MTRHPAKKIHWNSEGFGTCGGNTHGSDRAMTTTPSEVTCARCKEQFGTAMKYHGVTPDASVTTLRSVIAALPDGATWDCPYSGMLRFYSAEGALLASVDKWDGVTRP